jgi:hypothetical protein
MSDKDRKSKTPDSEEFRDIMEAVQDTIPQLISQLVQSIYSQDVAKNIAESVGTLYQNLKKQGLPEDLALEMTRNYMNIMDIKDLISKGMGQDRQAEDWGEEIERRIRRKRAEKEKD